MGFAEVRGEMAHGVLILLEALGEQEALQGIPAVGPTGQLLNRMIYRLRDPESGRLLRPQDFAISNTVWCRPFETAPDGRVVNRTPTEDEVADCLPRYAEPLIRRLNPRAILACGGVAMRALTGHEGIGKLRGYPLQSYLGIPVISTYHPAFLMKGKLALTRVWQMDLRKALYIARHGLPPAIERDYLLDPSPVQFAAWGREALLKLDAGARLFFDIETPYAGMLKDEVIDPEDIRVEDDASYTITRVSFSVEENKAVSASFMPGYVEVCRELLAHPGAKGVWNRFFDIPRLDHNGCPVRGRVYDGMDMWHFTEPGFPMGLKYATTFFCPDMPPWVLDKHTKPAYYNAADSDTALRVVNGCEARLKAEGRWDIFERHFVDLGVALQKMSLRGIPTDPAKREEKRIYYQGLFDREIQEVQPLISDTLKPIGKPFKAPEEKLRAQGKWVEGRMVPVKVTRRETAADIPPGEKCDRKACAQRWTFKSEDGKMRCEKHLTQKMRGEKG